MYHNYHIKRDPPILVDDSGEQLLDDIILAVKQTAPDSCSDAIDEIREALYRFGISYSDMEAQTELEACSEIVKNWRYNR